MNNQVSAAGDWLPASAAPMDVKVTTRFMRDGEVIERRMRRLLPALWWDEEFSQYAYSNPFEFKELEAK